MRNSSLSKLLTYIISFAFLLTTLVQPAVANGPELHRWVGTGDIQGIEARLSNANQLTQLFHVLSLDSGLIYTAYCLDILTVIRNDVDYRIDLLEDVTYFADASVASRIRAIANRSFNGTNLATVRGYIGDSSLTAREAVTANQMAFWTLSNGATIDTAYYNNANASASVKRIKKLFDYYIGLSGVPAPNVFSIETTGASYDPVSNLITFTYQSFGTNNDGTEVQLDYSLGAPLESLKIVEESKETVEGVTTVVLSIDEATFDFDRQYEIQIFGTQTLTDTFVFTPLNQQGEPDRSRSQTLISTGYERNYFKEKILKFNIQEPTYKLTINYLDEDGTQIASSMIEDALLPGIDYSHNSPFVSGYELIDNTQAIISGTMPRNDVEIDVIYSAIDYTFTFDPNFGDVANVVQGFNVGGSVEGTSFTRPGYTFIRWTTDEEGLTEYTGGLTNLPAENIYVYAQWEAVDYTFTFDPNFGDGANVVQDFNVGGSVAGTSFTRSGYTFIRWTLDEEGLTEYTGGLTNLPAENIYVYAQWKAVDYTFTFDPNFGEGANVVQGFNVGGSVAGTSFTRPGFTFEGWTLDEEGLTEYTGGLTNLPAENIYVYAQWEAVDYTFTFDPNFGDGANVVQSFNVGGSVAGTVFTRPGYTFDGWTLDEAGLTPYTGDLTNLPAENIYVYAQWEAIDYTFTFDPNFGDGANVVQSFNVGGSVAGTVFTRPGYTFDGWTLDEAGLTPYTGGLTNLPAENIYVYAQWEAIDYTFTFDPNFGDGANVVQSFNVGGSVAGTVFTRPGYTFDGWTLDEAGLTPYTGDLTNLPAENIYVYAQWEAIDYTFTFDPNFGDGANVVQVFNVGGSVAGTVFVREGFDFVGWTLDEEGLIDYEGGLTDLPAENIYVYAQWAEVLGEEDETFVLRFVANMEGLTYFDIVFSAGDSITPPAPVVEGYDFLGWFMDAEFSELFEEFDNMPARDVTVFADWGEVLGEEEEIPQTSDNFNGSLAFFLFILGLIATTLVKKEEENV